jgi:hypothetical protein
MARTARLSVYVTPETKEALERWCKEMNSGGLGNNTTVSSATEAAIGHFLQRVDLTDSGRFWSLIRAVDGIDEDDCSEFADDGYDWRKLGLTQEQAGEAADIIETGLEGGATYLETIKDSLREYAGSTQEG